MSFKDPSEDMVTVFYLVVSTMTVLLIIVFLAWQVIKRGWGALW